MKRSIETFSLTTDDKVNLDLIIDWVGLTLALHRVPSQLRPWLASTCLYRVVCFTVLPEPWENMSLRTFLMGCSV